MSLHVYANDVIEWYVAESAEEAAALAETHMREDCGLAREEMDLAFTLCPDDKSLTIAGEDGQKSTKTCAEWAAENGKGFLATTEY